MIRFLVLFFLVTLGSTGQVFAKSDLSEKEKIDYLVSKIASVEGSFVRNGSKHTPQEASQHIKKKISYAGDRLKTARQFIDKLASRSYFSGNPYFIHFADGRKRTTRIWMLQQLHYLEEGYQVAETIALAPQG